MPFYVEQDDVPRVWYSIWTAAEYGDEACVRAHVKRGMDPNAVDHGYTALHLAAQHNHFRIVEFLLASGASPDPGTPCTPLHRAAYAGALESVRLLIEAGASLAAVDSSFGDLRTPLHKARSVDVALLLVDGSDLEACDKDGATPLHVAAETGNLDVIDLLMERGACVEVVDKRGRTPAHRAAERGHRDALAVVFSVKEDNDGRTPLDLLVEEVVVAPPPPPRFLYTRPVGVVEKKKKSGFELSDDAAKAANSIFSAMRASDERRRHRQ